MFSNRVSQKIKHVHRKKALTCMWYKENSADIPDIVLFFQLISPLSPPAEEQQACGPPLPPDAYSNIDSPGPNGSMSVNAYTQRGIK